MSKKDSKKEADKVDAPEAVVEDAKPAHREADADNFREVINDIKSEINELEAQKGEIDNEIKALHAEQTALVAAFGPRQPTDAERIKEFKAGVMAEQKRREKMAAGKRAPAKIDQVMAASRKDNQRKPARLAGADDAAE